MITLKYVPLNPIPGSLYWILTLVTLLLIRLYAELSGWRENKDEIFHIYGYLGSVAIAFVQLCLNSGFISLNTFKSKTTFHLDTLIIQIDGNYSFCKIWAAEKYEALIIAMEGIAMHINDNKTGLWRKMLWWGWTLCIIEVFYQVAGIRCMVFIHQYWLISLH